MCQRLTHSQLLWPPWPISLCSQVSALGCMYLSFSLNQKHAKYMDVGSGYMWPAPAEPHPQSFGRCSPKSSWLTDCLPEWRAFWRVNGLDVQARLWGEILDPRLEQPSDTLHSDRGSLLPAEKERDCLGSSLDLGIMKTEASGLTPPSHRSFTLETSGSLHVCREYTPENRLGCPAVEGSLSVWSHEIGSCQRALVTGLGLCSVATLLHDPGQAPSSLGLSASSSIQWGGCTRPSPGAH